MNPVANDVLKRLRRPGRLGETPWPDEFIWPAYDGYSVANVAPTVLRHFGIGGVGAPGLADEVVGARTGGRPETGDCVGGRPGLSHAHGRLEFRAGAGFQYNG